MFYRPQDGHGLPHNPFNAIVTPRPIAWVSTRGPLGDNLAPYSFFNAVAYVPPQVMFASTGTKDSLTNLRDSGVFAINIVEASAIDKMNATSAAIDGDEFTHAGITKAECDTITCPRVAGAPATLECEVTEILPLKGDDNFAVFGEVTGIHIRDDCLVDGRYDLTKVQPLSRLGYRDYTVIKELFELGRPDDYSACSAR